MTRSTTQHLLRRLAGAAAATGLAVAGLVAVAAPASAAACSGSAGVTVVVDTGSSISTTCASGDPSSALKALTSAGFSVTYPQQYPGAVVCRINGYPSSDPCVRMPPADAYWAFFHAKRGGSWVYSSNGVASYDPAPGTVVGFRFGSGQQPRTAPPAPTRTSAPRPTTTTTKPRPTAKPTTAAAKPTTPRAAATTPKAPTSTGSTPGTAGGSASTRPSATASPGGTASTSASPSATGPAGSTATPTASASDLAAAPTSADAGGGNGPGTLLAGGALVALVAAGAGWAAWKRRT